MNNINKNYILIGGIALIIVAIIIAYLSTLNKTEENTYQVLEIQDKNEEKIEETKEKIKVHIAGSVVNEGIVELEENARVADAIKEAGGTTVDANMEKVNLAYKLQDGQKIYIPNNTEENYTIISESMGEEISNIKIGTGKININTATQTELELLTGIGPSTASKIINYREENGKFKTIEEIKNVSGIGEAKYESIKEEITV